MRRKREEGIRAKRQNLPITGHASTYIYTHIYIYIYMYWSGAMVAHAGLMVVARRARRCG